MMHQDFNNKRHRSLKLRKHTEQPRQSVAAHAETRADLDANDKGYRSLQEAEQVVWQHGQQQALPGEGPQQGDERQHTRAQQADVGAEQHQLLLQQHTCNGVSLCVMSGTDFGHPPGLAEGMADEIQSLGCHRV